MVARVFFLVFSPDENITSTVCLNGQLYINLIRSEDENLKMVARVDLFQFLARMRRFLLDTTISSPPSPVPQTSQLLTLPSNNAQKHPKTSQLLTHSHQTMHKNCFTPDRTPLNKIPFLSHLTSRRRSNSFGIFVSSLKTIISTLFVYFLCNFPVVLGPACNPCMELCFTHAQDFSNFARIAIAGM